MRFGMDAVSEEFQVDLMADSDAGGHNTQLFKSLLSPAQKFIAFVIATEFNFDIAGQGIECG